MKCNKGIESLKTYRKEYSDTLSTFRDRPLHDWSSHGADAFRILANGLSGIENSFTKSKFKFREFTLKGEHSWMAV